MTPISVDVGVLERSDRVVVLPGDFGWDDVGTWGALKRVAADGRRRQCARRDDVYAVESRDNVVHAPGVDGRPVRCVDLVVVVENGLVLVTTVDRSSDLKTLIDALPRGRPRARMTRAAAP